MKKMILSTLALVAFAANAQDIKAQAIDEIFQGYNNVYVDAPAAKKVKKDKGRPFVLY